MVLAVTLRYKVLPEANRLLWDYSTLCKRMTFVSAMRIEGTINSTCKLYVLFAHFFLHYTLTTAWLFEIDCVCVRVCVFVL